MKLTDLLRPDLTFCNVQGVSKKRLLEKSADLIASRVEQADAGALFEALIAREQLGSTGIGNGIAVPHCRVKNLTETAGALVKLQQPVDFDAIDNQPVDLLFVLAVPENTIQGHLEALKAIAENFSNKAWCDSLRAAQTDEELYAAATSPPQAS